MVVGLRSVLYCALAFLGFNLCLAQVEIPEPQIPVPTHVEITRPQVPSDNEEVYWVAQPIWPPHEERHNPSAQEFSSVRGGLIQYTNLYTGRNIFLIMPPMSAENLKEGEDKLRVGMNFSSVYQVDKAHGYDANFDYEEIEAFINANYGLLENIEVGLYVRAFVYNAGRYDKTLNNFHSNLGFSLGPREDAPENQYSNTVKKESGEEVYSTRRDQFSQGDMIGTAKFKVFEEEKYMPAMALAIALKAPTGNRSLGYSSGSWDQGTSVAATKQLTRDVKAHFNVGVAFLGKSDVFDNLSDVYNVMSALEYYVNKQLSVVVQSNYSTSPFRKWDFETMNEDSWTTGIGAHIRFPKNIQLHVHFTDEFYNHGDTDYVLGMALDLFSLREWWTNEAEEE